MTEEVAVEKEVHVNADLEKYTKAKSASGASSVNNGDLVATLLTGMTLDEAYEVAETFCERDYDYQHLNDGMARMNLGNRIRGHFTTMGKQTDKDRTAHEKANEALVADGKKAKPAFKEPKKPIELLEAICKPVRKLIDARVKAAEKEAADKVKAAEAKKAEDAKKEAAKAKKAA